MNDERVVEEIVTKFLLNTCQLRPQLSEPAVRAAMCYIRVATNRAVGENESNPIPLTTGSVAEFYIEPMLPHLGDIDVMCHTSTQLAIPRGHPPPTQLPDEFHNYVELVEITDSHLPGYVYLELSYLLTECIDDGKYNAVHIEHDRQLYLSNRWSRGDQNDTHGPAVLEALGGRIPSCDTVHCVRCLVWPLQAANWPTRHRNYGWPDSATVDHVVSNGCDVVGVAHRQCRKDKWMDRSQWRLSFSRAEIVLINSWMPIQQIVYHMLRVFMKTEQLTGSADNIGTISLSNYDIKTLMLWACELKSRNWWTDHLNLVKISVQLLHMLGDRLIDARCKHCFVDNCNLIDNSFNPNRTSVGGQLRSIDEKWLSKWFVDNYIRKCSQLCPDNVSRLFDDVGTSMKLQKAVSSVVAWRLNNTAFDLWYASDLMEINIPQMLYLQPLSARSCACWMTELKKTYSAVSAYFNAVVFLHVAYRAARHGLDDNLMDVLATLFGQYICRRQYLNNSTSLLMLGKAANLMKDVANKSFSIMSLIAIELSKAYLYRALSCEDSDRDSIYCMANVYLTVLYYTTGRYQTAMDHCTLVMRSQDHSLCSSNVVQGELLPKVDDNIDNMLGLAVFYQHVQIDALRQHHQAKYVSVLTTELFAHYLHIKCTSYTACCQFTQTSSVGELKRYDISISDIEQLFIGDVLLFVSLRKLLQQQCYHKPVTQQLCQPTINSSELIEPDLVELLQKSAIEQLTLFRQSQLRDFGSVVTIFTTDYEALYAYKRGDYQKCLQLYTHNVHTLLYAVKTPDILAFPEFIQLMDDDIVSLIALALIVNPKCRDDSCYVLISQVTLSLYLMTQCQLKLRHSVTSLAQTLHYIEVAHRRHLVNWKLDRLALKMIAHKAIIYMYLSTMMTKA